MRHFLFLLFVASALSGVSAADPAKYAPTTAAIPQAPWKICQLSFSKEGARVTLEEAASKKRVAVASASSDSTRLLSVTFFAEAGQLRVEAMVEGARVEITQKLSELDLESGSAGKRAGPTEEDRKKYENLSEKGRARFRDQLRQKFADETFRNASDEEKRAFIRATFEKIESEEQGRTTTPEASAKPAEQALEQHAEQREKYDKLSQQARDKFRNALREQFADEKFRNAPADERRAVMRALFEKIEKEDQMPR